MSSKRAAFKVHHAGLLVDAAQHAPQRLWEVEGGVLGAALLSAPAPAESI